jgi:DedD protein
MSGDRDSEITLGMGKLLGLFFGLVIFCGLSLGIGYKLGWNAAMQEATLHPGGAAASASANGEAETLEAAANGTTAQEADCSGDDCPPSTAVGNTASELTFYDTVQESKPEPKLTPSAPAAKTPPKSPSLSGGYVVQVAAVSREGDAKLLKEALQKQRYPVLITQPGDKLYHVQVGPYADLKDAKEIRSRLVKSGYSAFLKK